MKSFILILFIVGSIFLTIGYMENYKKCPLPKIEYRYIPRNFYEEQITDSNLKNLYSDMFNKADTWSKYPLGNEDNGAFDPKNFKNFIQEYGNNISVHEEEYDDDE